MAEETSREAAEPQATGRRTEARLFAEEAAS